MTYGCGILVRDGLVMLADTRTNAGLDNISTFRKLHLFERLGERVMMIATAGKSVDLAKCAVLCERRVGKSGNRRSRATD